MLPSLSFKQPIGFLLAKNYFNDIPDIIVDGIVDDKIKNSSTNNAHNICIQNNSNATFLNLDASNNFENMTTHIGNYDCSIPSINHTVYP